MLLLTILKPMKARILATHLVDRQICILTWHAQTRTWNSLCERDCIRHKIRTKNDHKKFMYFLVEEFGMYQQS